MSIFISQRRHFQQPAFPDYSSTRKKDNMSNNFSRTQKILQLQQVMSESEQNAFPMEPLKQKPVNQQSSQQVKQAIQHEQRYDSQPRRQQYYTPQTRNKAKNLNTAKSQYVSTYQQAYQSPFPKKVTPPTRNYYFDEDNNIPVNKQEVITIKKGSKPVKIPKPVPKIIEEEIKDTPTNECPICYSELSKNNSLQVTDNCNHRYHKSCLKEYIQHQISESRFPIQCPTLKCQQTIPDYQIKSVIGEQAYQKYDEFSLKQFIQANQSKLIVCRRPNCNYFVFKGGAGAQFYCPNCKVGTCEKCKGDAHPGKTCKEANIKFDDKDDLDFRNYVLIHQNQQCPGCLRWVERTEGCDSMECRCGTKFCYQCGALNQSCGCRKYNYESD